MSGISGVNLYELSLHHFNYILSSITFPAYCPRNGAYMENKLFKAIFILLY